MVRITEKQWADYYGFQRFPFDRPEAGNEEFARPEFLSASFVAPGNYERILGQPDAPVTALVFAARGAGKTACRVMADYDCREGQVYQGGQYVLSVPHIHLHQVHRLAQPAPAAPGCAGISAEHHAEEILRRAVPAFTELVARAPALREAVQNLSPLQRLDLRWFVETYSHYLTAPQAMFLQNLIGDAPVDASPWLATMLQNRARAAPVAHLTLWADLVHQIGVQATYVFVDGIDEFQESAGDARAAFVLVQPLLSNLDLMDGTPYLALKFFLPDSIEPFVMQDAAIRKDRGFIIERIHWQEADLIRILRRRLDALKLDESKAQDRTMYGFGALCVPGLRGEIETKLAQQAAGNPRHLMILCGLMVSAHCAREIEGQDDPYELNEADWDAAKAAFAQRIGQPAAPLAVGAGTAASALAGRASATGAVDDPPPRPPAVAVPPLAELLTRSEGEQLEFKSSLRWDYRQNARNEDLQIAVMKAICGMLNSQGGILLVGVQDDGTVIGIERDLKTLQKQSADGFELLLTDLVKNYLGLEHRNRVHVDFAREGGRQVCVIAVERSPAPVFLHIGGRDEFWVRMGNSTRQLDAKAALHYIQAHWSDAG